MCFKLQAAILSVYIINCEIKRCVCCIWNINFTIWSYLTVIHGPGINHLVKIYTIIHLIFCLNSSRLRILCTFRYGLCILPGRWSRIVICRTAVVRCCISFAGSIAATWCSITLCRLVTFLRCIAACWRTVCSFLWFLWALCRILCWLFRFQCILLHRRFRYRRILAHTGHRLLSTAAHDHTCHHNRYDQIFFLHRLLHFRHTLLMANHIFQQVQPLRIYRFSLPCSGALPAFLLNNLHIKVFKRIIVPVLFKVNRLSKT